MLYSAIAELTDSLIDAGFSVEQVYGDWDRGQIALWIGAGTEAYFFTVVVKEVAPMR